MSYKVQDVLASSLIHDLSIALQEKYSIEGVEKFISDLELDPSSVEEPQPKKRLTSTPKPKEVQKTNPVKPGRKKAIRSSPVSEEEPKPQARLTKKAPTKKAPTKKEPPKKTVKKMTQSKLTKKKGEAPTISEDKTDTDTKQWCMYVFKSGSRKGQQCGKLATIQIGDKWYCGTKKIENGEVKYSGHARNAYIAFMSKKYAPSSSQGKKTDTKKNNKSKTLKEIRLAKDKKSEDLINRMISEPKINLREIEGKAGYYEHLVSHISFKRETGEVVGVYNLATKDFDLLEDEHVRICEANGWKFNPDIVKEMETKPYFEEEVEYVDEEEGEEEEGEGEEEVEYEEVEEEVEYEEVEEGEEEVEYEEVEEGEEEVEYEEVEYEEVEEGEEEVEYEEVEEGEEEVEYEEVEYEEVEEGEEEVEYEEVEEGEEEEVEEEVEDYDEEEDEDGDEIEYEDD